MVVAPREGFEPSTRRFTAGCSTVELSRNRPRPTPQHIKDARAPDKGRSSEVGRDAGRRGSDRPEAVGGMLLVRRGRGGYTHRRATLLAGGRLMHTRRHMLKGAVAAAVSVPGSEMLA